MGFALAATCVMHVGSPPHHRAQCSQMVLHCPCCNKAFVHRDRLRSHQATCSFMVCPVCTRGFATARALGNHRARSGHNQGGWDCAGEALPPPPPPELPAPRDQEADEDMPPVEWAALEDAWEEDPNVAEARRMARRMLVQDGWVEWAKQQLEYAEQGALKDVTSLFPTREDFDTEETFRFAPRPVPPVPPQSPPHRYLELKATFPGAQFSTELLKANKKKHLDLDKVPHP